MKRLIKKLKDTADLEFLNDTSTIRFNYNDNKYTIMIRDGKGFDINSSKKIILLKSDDGHDNILKIFYDTIPDVKDIMDTIERTEKDG